MKYRMTQEQYNRLAGRIAAAQNAPLIMLQTGMPETVQSAANSGWDYLGNEMGFKSMTARPDPTGDQFDFIAEPKETP